MDSGPALQLRKENELPHPTATPMINRELTRFLVPVQEKRVDLTWCCTYIHTRAR